jgi:hypothetical protein
LPGGVCLSDARLFLKLFPLLPYRPTILLWAGACWIK